jgi:hypothetical protein
MESLDQKIKAVCDTCGDERTLTFRTLKNKWAMCKKCRPSKPMRIKSNADTFISTPD